MGGAGLSTLPSLPPPPHMTHQPRDGTNRGSLRSDLAGEGGRKRLPALVIKPSGSLPEREKETETLHQAEGRERDGRRRVTLY